MLTVCPVLKVCRDSTTSAHPWDWFNNKMKLSSVDDVILFLIFQWEAFTMLISILVLWYTGLLFVSHVNHWLKSDSFFYSSLFVACSCQGKTSRYKKMIRSMHRVSPYWKKTPHGSRGMKSFDFADIVIPFLPAIPPPPHTKTMIKICV